MGNTHKALQIMPSAPLDMPKIWSLRTVLVTSLMLFSVLPAALVGGLMYRSSQHTASTLANKIVSDVVQRVQLGTEAHIAEAHTLLNGLLPESPSGPQVLRARLLLEKPALFEQTVFALTRMTPNIPYLYFGTYKGEFLGVEAQSQNSVDGFRVGVRSTEDSGRRFFSALQPGDRSKALPPETKVYEPRNRPWYQAAMQARGRVFTQVYPSASKKQLLITLAQPVFGEDGQNQGASGVFAVDLYLKHLSELLQSQRISARGAAFLVDDEGYLIASSAGDALYSEADSKLLRLKPSQSANPAIRIAYQEMLPSLGKTKEQSVERIKFEGRVGHGNDALIVFMQPFGEQLGLRWSLVVAAPESDFTSDVQTALKTSLLVMLAVMLLGAMLAVFFAHRLSQHFVRLSHAAAQLGRGTLPKIDQATRIREVRQLSSVLHDSAEKLDSYRAEVQAKTEAIEEANQQLESRVVKRTIELVASREEALQAAKAKASFLATMSHEIRTPLNGVLGMSTLLAETRLDDEQTDYLQTIRLSSDQLLGVINDILDFSKIESGKLELESEPLSPRAAIEEACDIAASRAREKKLELIVDVAGFEDSTSMNGADGVGVPAAIAGDITRLRQVLINLINNAIKFTEKGEVTVSVRLQPNFSKPGFAGLEFRVTDTGIGIPPERVGALFHAFTQVDASTTRKYGGTGLGLAICKRLVELMGGQIGVESVLGQGSSFWFTLQAPLAQLSTMLGAVDATLLQGGHALVVDDHETNVRVLTRQLELWGMRVSSASSGEKALQMLALAQGEGQLPDVVITDMHMPGMDGVGLAQAIKAKEHWSVIPLVLLTSGFMPPGHEAAQMFAARLLKPTRQKQLFDTVARCIATRQEQGMSGPAPLNTSDIAPKQSVVLVADDNAVNLKVACALLARLGYQTQTALDGQEALEAVARAHAADTYFGAVLMDLNMPRLNGLQATQQIHALLGAQSPPIIALTAAASDEDRNTCLEAGMNDYLTKPLAIQSLSDVLERWFEQPVNQPLAKLEAAAGATRLTLPAAGEADAEPALMDFERLAQFKEFDDDQLSMTREVVALFRTDALQRMDAIEHAIRLNDALALSWACHALVGAAGNVGAVAMQSIAAGLEQYAKAGSVPVNALQVFDKLQSCWLKTRAVLDAAV